MAYTTINKSTDYFNTKLYTGNFSTNAITGVGFAPNFVWIKERSSTSSHVLGTTVQGVNKRLQSDTNAAEGTLTNIFTSFDSDGFTNGADNGVNQNGETYASWNWKAGTAVSGQTTGSGTYKTYTGSVNTTSGFSIIKYTGNGTAGHTIPHHLGVVPKMIIVKSISAVQSWIVLPPTSDGYNKDMKLEDTSALGNSDVWNNTAPTSTVFSVGSNTNMNDNNATFISYSFAEKQGYSKFGTYVGNNNVDGTFVYTGFSPAFIMVKKTSASGNGWQLRDNKRTPYGNETKNLMYASATSAEQTTDGFDFLSNGFKWRNQAGDCNGNGDYIYMAFAEAPLVGTNDIPANAR